MKVWKRVLAFLCAALLILNLALYPLRARATVGALTAVSAAVTVSAFLMACGIYPYTEDGQSFAEWGAESLYDLWGQYVGSFEGGQLPSGGTLGTFNQIKSFVVGGTLAIASGTWEVLRGFASWIVDKFKVQDNQTGIELSSLPDNTGYVPFIVVQDILPESSLLQAGETMFFGINGSSSLPPVKVCIGYTSSTQRNPLLVFGAVSSDTYPGVVVEYKSISDSPGNAKYSASWSNLRERNSNYPSIAFYTLGASQLVWAESFGALSSFDTVADTMAFLGGQLVDDTPAVTIDTTTVAPLEPLPADTPYGGLTVPGAGVSPTATAVKDVIETGVTDREKPVVRPVEVEIGTGTEVDSETGEVTENPVVVTPEDVIPTVAALSPPASFLSALQTALTTKFPFCLPFDLFKILQAFYVPPEAPVFSLSFHDPFSNSDFSITVDLSPWDEVAAVVRTFEAMILLAGFCLNFDKFNVIHLILGGLG